ncbi:membrane protein [Caloranaerobacter sp. TR13]|uniref:YIEGIA family protein n=1 Tax=Caloranaerobacter sp. TR13 TaxID=1302151 RepID=UPI0006D45764|nr:YIEGIA family protein [Caloranaerobacter sp. TR13]KPU28306.1 membrane protein [Caloranaerobacter sp. TR13]
MFNYSHIIIPSIMLGILSRISMLRVDYRQYPSYPQGVFSHLTLGIIAAGLGSVALPALWEKEYAAVTFLALAAQQFRDVRNLERQSLDNIEPTELVARGTAYIEDIAKAFEARNYMTMLTSLIVSIVIFLLFNVGVSRTQSIIIGVIIGLISIYYFNKAIARQTIGDIADVVPAEIKFKGPLLTINDVVIMNIGLKESRKIYEEKGIAVEIIPHDENGIATLANLGQRQAIQHNAAALLGIRKDVDEPDFTPIARRNPETGNIVMAIVPMEPDIECLVEAVKRTVVLESAKRKPLDTKVARKAAD